MTDSKTAEFIALAAEHIADAEREIRRIEKKAESNLVSALFDADEYFQAKTKHAAWSEIAGISPEMSMARIHMGVSRKVSGGRFVEDSSSVMQNLYRRSELAAWCHVIQEIGYYLD